MKGLIKKTPQPETFIQKKGFMDYLTEIIGLVQIIVCCLISGAILSLIIYLVRPSAITFIVGIILTTISLFIGVVWGIRSYRGKGTMDLIGKYRASPELDDLENTG